MYICWCMQCITSFHFVPNWAWFHLLTFVNIQFLRNLIVENYVVCQVFPSYGKAKLEWNNIDDVCLNKILNINKTENMSCTQLPVQYELSLGDLTLFLNMSGLALVCYRVNPTNSYPDHINDCHMINRGNKLWTTMTERLKLDRSYIKRFYRDYCIIFVNK